MTIAEQGHKPANSPNSSGGQFTGKANTDPDRVVYENMNGTGSFLFPVIDPSMGVPAFIEYWENSSPSDRVLSNVMHSYRVARDRHVSEQLSLWSDAFKEDPSVLAWADLPHVTKQDIENAYQAERQRALERISAERPITRISSLSVRQVAIAAQMYNSSVVFTPEEQEQIDNHRITVSRDKGPQTIRDICNEYRTGEWFSDALTDNDLGVQSVVEELRLARERSY